MKQVWASLSIKTDKPEVVVSTLEKSKKVRNIQALEGKVTYEQLGWEDGRTTSEIHQS